MKKGLKLLICTLAIVCVISGCKKKATPVKTQEPTNQPGTTISDVKSEELSITNLSISFDEKEGLSTVVADVKNETNSDISLNSLTISLLDDKKKNLVDTIVDLGNSIKAGETKTFTAKITMDVRKATQVTYKINN